MKSALLCDCVYLTHVPVRPPGWSYNQGGARELKQGRASNL